MEQTNNKIMKKLAPIIAVLLSFIPVHALGSFTALESMGNFLMRIFSLSWITDKVSATKFAFFLIILSVVYAVLHAGLLKPKGGAPATMINEGLFKSSKTAGVVSFAIAAIATIFMPDQVAYSVGNFYSMVAVILIASVPSFVILILTYKLTNPTSMGASLRPWARHGIRLLAVLLALVLVSALAAQYGVYV